MKQLLLSLVTAVACLQAEVKPGENLLLNGTLDSADIDQATGMAITVPEFWAKSNGPNFIKYDHKGSPSGHGVLTFFGTPESKSPESTVRQYNLQLVPNARYRISALVKTEDFNSNHCGIIIYDHGWNHSVGLQNGMDKKDFPANQDWTPMSKEFDLIPSANNDYNFALFVCNGTGKLSIADVKLEAVSEDALRGSAISEMAKMLTQPILMPWEPLVNCIPAHHDGTDPEITFRFAGRLPYGTNMADYNLRYTVNGKETVLPLKNGFNVLKLAGLKAGDFKLGVAIVSRDGAQKVYAKDYDATVIEVPAVDASAHRRLNNLVVEVLNQPLKATADVQTATFSTRRNGWIFIAAQNADADGLEITLDGKLMVINAATPRLESFRDVLMGGHTLTVKGAAKGGTLIVRSIPEIFNYCPGANSGVPENPKYDWEFQKKYVLPAVTTQNGGNIPKEHRAEFFAAGYKWIANLGTTNLKNGEDLVTRLNKCPGMNAPEYQGVSCDEQFFNQPQSILPYTDGIKKYVQINDHVIYTWITNAPGIAGAHHDFITACINASRSRGRLISEVYCRTQPTLEAARTYLDDVIISKTRAYKSFYPQIINHWGIILGDFNQIPILSLAHHPNVDYKYYLDLQFNYLANHPECRDMAVTGYWGSYYADHELHRWAFKLTRHYCVEGKKNMLSDEYGFSYDPKHLTNGDFTNGLDGWQVSGQVRQDKHDGFASKSQNRWGGNGGQGDTFAVFTKKDTEISSVSQTARGLVPGKTYCLQFSTADFKDVKTNGQNFRRYGVDVTLGPGAEVRDDLSWVHVDKRVKGRYTHNNGVARCNLHHLVFTATKPELSVTFTNAQAKAGEELGLNYIMLTPFLLED